jgi:hypothetical protein
MLIFFNIVGDILDHEINIFYVCVKGSFLANAWET